MRRFFGWTVIFRGNFYGNLIHMFKVLYNIVIWIFRVIRQIIRYLLRFILAIIGINWFEVERYIHRKIRVYLA